MKMKKLFKKEEQIDEILKIIGLKVQSWTLKKQLKKYTENFAFEPFIILQ